MIGGIAALYVMGGNGFEGGGAAAEAGDASAWVGVAWVCLEGKNE